VILSVGRLSRASRAPGDLRPDPVNAPWVTMGWVRGGVHARRIPALPHPDAELLANDRLRLSLMQVDTARGAACAALRGPVDRTLRAGERLRIGNGAVSVRALAASGPSGLPVSFGNVLLGLGPKDHELLAISGPLRVRVAPIPGKPAQLC
jgi:hypothetical protein